MKVDPWPIGRVKPYPGNPRDISDRAVEKVATSIREFGFNQPIVVDKKGVVVVGHTRLRAAQKLGLKEVPVLVVDLPAAKAMAYRIADNRTHEEAVWVDELLRIEFGALKDLDFDLSFTGFDAAQIGRVFAMNTRGGHTEPDDVPAAPARPVSRLGDVWELGDHRIVCGDSTSKETVDACLLGEKPPLMVTDPPYGVEYDPEWRRRAGVNTATAATGKVTNDDRADWREAWALFPGDVAYVWHGGLHAGEVAAGLVAAGFAIRSQIIWNKNALLISRGDYHWKHEPCWYAVRKGKVGRFAGGRKQSTVWDIDKPRKSETGHSTQKPVECMKRPIDNNSRPGDLVYEPFSGSGTTIIAAEMAERRCRAIELSPAYVDVAIIRWQNFTGKTATLDGVAFEEVERERGKGKGGKARSAGSRAGKAAREGRTKLRGEAKEPAADEAQV